MSFQFVFRYKRLRRDADPQLRSVSLSGERVTLYIRDHRNSHSTPAKFVFTLACRNMRCYLAGGNICGYDSRIWKTAASNERSFEGIVQASVFYLPLVASREIVPQNCSRSQGETGIASIRQTMG